MHDTKIEMKIEEETKGLKELCTKLEKRAGTWFDDMKEVDTEEAGQVIDMIKDLCEAKEKVVKTCYYKSIVKAMEKAEEEEEKYKEFEKHRMESGEEDGWGRMGYRGRDSLGRFVHRPGRGRSAGYTPYMYMMEDLYDDEYDFPEMMNYRMGYSGGRGGNSGSGGSRGGSRGGNSGGGRGGQGGNSGGQGGGSGRSVYDGGYGYDGEYEGGEQYGYSRGGQGGSGNQGGRNEGSRYGRSYDRYSDARRHYHDEKDMESMKRMEESFSEILDDFGDIADDTWKDLSPEQKNKQKPKINQMIQKLQKLQQM